MGKSYLVTGSTGFIGNQLINKLLSDGSAVRALTRKEIPETGTTGIEYRCCDLTDPSSLYGIAEGIHTVFHLAGYAHADTGHKGIHYNISLEGTRNLLAELKRSHVNSCIYVSSVKAMPEPGTECLDEDATGKPADEYGMPRYLAEKLLLQTGAETGMHVSILRPALVYGPGCKGNLASMLHWIDKGLFPPVPDTGNRRSMVDVRDLVRAILLAADTDPANGKVFIITDGQDYSTRRIYQAMRAALGKPSSARALPVWLLRALGRAGDAVETILGHPALYNSAKCARLLDSACYHSLHAKSALGFQPEYQLEDALPEMAEMYRQQAAQGQ